MSESTVNPYCVASFVCANCGKQKGEANHWIVIIDRRYPHCASENNLQVFPWNAERATAKNAKPACGDECSHKILSQFLSSFPHASVRPASAEVTNPAVDSNGTEGDRQPDTEDIECR